MNNVWYVGLEPLNARYTRKLCTEWVPRAFERSPRRAGWGWVDVPIPDVGREIKVGRVLDAQGRGVVSLAQMSWLVERADRVGDGDVVYLQDFWTPGLEALLYALHQLGRRPRIYARNFAQSVDVYDFTYGMRRWMRPVELGLAAALSGMFVASEVHREQLRAAGYDCPIHVTGLPFSLDEKRSHDDARTRPPRVMFTSRLDGEKNPWFMLEVARAFLQKHHDWTWLVTTSAAHTRTRLPGLLAAANRLREDVGDRFTMRSSVGKDEYLELLRNSRIQFNSSLQDYVSFTMLEAAHSGCDLCYPAYRSFPECVTPLRLYRPFEVASALSVLEAAQVYHITHTRAPEVCDMGLVVELSIMLSGYAGDEVNVWHQPRAFFQAEGLV